MDAISYSYADKAHKRIKKFINEPDSTSGVVTVPSTIASGETITIPAGRVAILPNVQIDGVLNVENGGEVFIPSGATLSTVVEKVTSTDNAIVRFDGTTGKVQNSGVIIDDNGNVLAVSPTGGIGYGTGSGGTVTQLTSKGTAVTLNKPTGQIITNNAALAANTYIGFAISNTLITASDTLSVNIGGNGALSAYDSKCMWCVAGQAYIRLQNVDSISRSDAVPINFSIIKGATS